MQVPCKTAIVVAIASFISPTGFAVAQEAPAPSASPTSNSAGAPSQQMLDGNAYRILIRNSLVAVNQANITGNYTVLRQLGTPGFQQSNSPDRLADVFKDLRDRGLDIAPIVVLEPKLRRQPSLSDDGQLRLTGFFPSQPSQVNFDLAFYKRNGRWLLDGIALNVTPSQAAALPSSTKTNADPASNSPPAPAKKPGQAPTPQNAAADAPSSAPPKKPAASASGPTGQNRGTRSNASRPSPAKNTEPKKRGWNPFSVFRGGG